MYGFGGSQTFHGDALADYAGRERVYEALFGELKLDIFRLRNYHEYEGQQEKFEKITREFATAAQRWSDPAKRGDKGPVRLLFTSWSPPARLKSNNSVRGLTPGDKAHAHATLKRLPNEKYAYNDFADWWLASVEKFKALSGDYPDYITIQNELDWAVSYDGCEFMPTEGTNKDGVHFAGYDQALFAVADRLKAALGAQSPKILGPETFTIRLTSDMVGAPGAPNTPRAVLWADPTTASGQSVLDRLFGVSYHIYGSNADPSKPQYERFHTALQAVANTYRPLHKPMFQTEFLEGQTLTELAEMIHDTLAIGEASSYFVWISGRTARESGEGLVYYNPEDQSIERRERFYAMKHFSAFMGEGWNRVDASSSDPAVLLSAYVKPKSRDLVAVLINPTDKERRVVVAPEGNAYKSVSATIYRTVQGESGERWRQLPLPADNVVTLPARSVATVKYAAPATLAQDKVAVNVPPLKNAFKGKFLIGAVLGTEALRGNAADKVALATTHFSAITAANAMKPDALQPLEGQFTFATADRLVEIAQQSGATPIGHTLVWHNQTPKWFFEGKDGQPLSREVALQRLRTHIKTVVGHYKGRVKEWDVVNEAIPDGPGVLRETPWLKAIGEDYIAEAFRAAHEADPDAILIYNDYNIERAYKRPKAMQLLKSLLNQKVPIHAVGIQAHWRMPDLKLAEVEESIKQFAALGLKVMVTEMDIGVLPSRTQGADITAVETMTPEQAAVMNPYTAGLPNEVAQQQAELYRQAFEMFLRHKDKIGRVSLWGTDDDSSWLNNFPIRGRTDYALIFDRQGKPKPAFFAIRDVALAQDVKAPATGTTTTTPATATGTPRLYRGNASVPSARGDANSMAAHEQLVVKAKAGGIDLYFLGDSITRRWGTSDAQWSKNLENWKQNFYGWNAGNFGWGADGIQNMLWRIQNGELDGVNPKVIVILAGTNNVGKTPDGGAKVADIVKGIRALVDTCRQKAPKAKIIVTGITPRTDGLAITEEIRKINDQIARFADGQNIFYLNINDKLSNPEGTPKEGMTIDGLHLSVTGYQVWADALKPLLTQLLGPPAATDHAPPPTGDPSAASPAPGS
jgi:endo-1,4-beta-xylanase